MSRRFTWLLIVAVVALAIYLFGYELPREREAAQQQTDQARLMVFDPAEVDTLRLVRDGREILVARDAEGTWWLRAPRNEKAFRMTVENQLSLLAGSRATRRLAESLPADQLERYGLDPDPAQRIRLEVVTRDGSRQALFVGRLSPGEAFAYVQREGSDALELAQPDLYQIAWSRPNTYRQSRLFEVESDSIKRISIEGPHGPWSARRDEIGLWWRDDERVDRRTLQGIAHDLASGRIRSFVRDDATERDFAAYGLADPYASISFDTAGGGSHRLEFGNEAEEGQVFARRDGDDSVLQVLPQLPSRADIDPSTLVDTNPILRNFAELDSLRVRWEDGTEYRLRWIDETWKLTMVGDWPGSADEQLMATRNVIEGLERFQVDDTMLLSRGSGPESVLERMPLRATMWFGDDQVELLIGWFGRGEYHWVRVNDEPELLRTERQLFMRLRGFFLSAGLLRP